MPCVMRRVGNLSNSDQQACWVLGSLTLNMAAAPWRGQRGGGGGGGGGGGLNGVAVMMVSQSLQSCAVSQAKP